MFLGVVTAAAACHGTRLDDAGTRRRNYVPCKTTRRARLHKFYFPRLTARGKYNGSGVCLLALPSVADEQGRFFMVMRQRNEHRLLMAV